MASKYFSSVFHLNHFLALFFWVSFVTSKESVPIVDIAKSTEEVLLWHHYNLRPGRMDPQQVRLMLDADFENGRMDPWYDVSPTAPFWKVEDNLIPFEAGQPAPPPDFGTKYARIKRNAILESGFVYLITDPFTSSPGDRVSFSYWIRSLVPQGNTLELVMITQGSVTTLANLTSFSNVNNFDWRIYRPVSIPVKQPTTIQLAFVGFSGSNTEDAMAIDDIVVKFDTSATTDQPGNTTPSTAIPTDSTTESSTAATFTSTTTETFSSRPTQPTTILTTTVTETCSSVYSPGIDMFTPGYPNYYPPNLDCRYLIRANIGKIVKVNYLYQYNDPKPPLEANADWIEMYDGSSTDKFLLNRFTGNDQGCGRRSTSNEMLVRLVTDSKNGNNRGFQITSIEESPILGCFGMYYESTGVIQSPYFPKTFLQTTISTYSCVYKIIVAPGSMIYFNLSTFDLVSEIDTIQVFDGLEDTSTNILTVYGLGEFFPTRSTSNEMMIRFTTKNILPEGTTKPNKGFSGTYTSEPLPPGCGGNFDSSTGTFTSPNFPLNYTVPINCKYLITVVQGYQISLVFNSVLTETNVDYIRIYDGPTTRSTLMASLTGEPFTPIKLDSYSNEMLVWFSTTGKNSARGFTASYTIF